MEQLIKLQTQHIPQQQINGHILPHPLYYPTQITHAPTAPPINNSTNHPVTGGIHSVSVPITNNPNMTSSTGNPLGISGGVSGGGTSVVNYPPQTSFQHVHLNNSGNHILVHHGNTDTTHQNQQNPLTTQNQTTLTSNQIYSNQQQQQQNLIQTVSSVKLSVGGR